MNTIECPKCHEVFQIDEAGYAAIVKQIRDKEFSQDVKNIEKQFQAEKESAVQVTKLESEKKLNDELNKKDKEIAELKNKIDSFGKDKEIELAKLLNEKNEKISEMTNAISKLNGEKELQEKEYELKEQALKEQYEDKLRFKDEEIARYKDFKARLNNKMLGESLEQHCEIEFNKLRPTGFKDAYFEKDNDIKPGTKGDYIFRDYADGQEFISIMFEMKNEADETSTKHKNEDFLQKLDKDRKDKKCEYAVLVSMLEPDNEFYNNGIVDMSHRYEKMYVIRPQFFIPMITLLRNAALNSLEYQKQLAVVRAQNIDVSNFENAVNDFKEMFSRHCELASKKFQTAIEEIDKTIDHLEKTKKALLSWGDHLRLANNKTEDLSIKRLTRNNPTMQAKFEELKKE